MLIREAKLEDAEAIAEVHIRSWREAFSPILSAEQIAAKDLDEVSQTAIWIKRLSEEEGKSRFTFVAEEENVEAYVSGGTIRKIVEGYDAELYQIYLLPAAQGKGLGKKLVKVLVQKLIEHDYRSLVVWVRTVNPAVAFYRDVLRGSYLQEDHRPEGNGFFVDAAYGWPDLEVLK